LADFLDTDKFYHGKNCTSNTTGFPHHITQRGNRRQQTFFCDDDYSAYIELMAQWCHKYQVDIWAWCLMPNHVHLHERTGRPLGKGDFIDKLEIELGRRLKPQKTGLKKKAKR